jgi:hypothetical protein
MYLCAVIIVYVSTPKENEGVEKNAEYLVVIEWDKESPNDVDSWLQDPHGNLCSFQRREDGLMHLDRDDRGKLNDEIVIANGQKIEFKRNTETTSIRAIAPGEYTFWVHLYSKNDIEGPTDVTVELIRLNPKVITLDSRIITLNNGGEAKTVFRFTVLPNGDVTEIIDLEKEFPNGSYGYPPDDQSEEGMNE